ncbi:Tyrosyl-tRNA synthetase [Hordeum vulgare]|nr:Tyrosyl-tRNA synthetase [Hordeum vulgare]
MAKIHAPEHEGDTAKMSKPNEHQNDAPKFDFTAIHLCGINYAESYVTLFEHGATTTTTSETIKEHALEASDKAGSKDVSSIFGGESDDVPSSALINGDDDDMVEHGIFSSTKAAFGDELSMFGHHIESESEFTTIPIYDELPQFPYEEIHNPHHLSETSDYIICDNEWDYQEGVSEPPPHRASPIYDDAPILNDFVLPLDKMMLMVEYDAPHMFPSRSI